MKKIRVAFFADVLTEKIDGAVRTMYQLIDRIDRNRFDYLFIYGEGPAGIKAFPSFKLPSVRLPFNKGYALAIPALNNDELNAALNNFDPDVLHIATPSLLGHFALKYAAASQLPVITIYHTHFISYVDYYFKYLPFLIDGIKDNLAKNHRSFYNQCNTVYVPSESIRAELKMIGIAGKKMKIWKRAIDSELFSPAKKDLEFMQALTGNNYPVILFASRLVWEKNLQTLSQIYDELQQAEVNFVIVGEGPARKQCAYKMPKAIFTGAVDHQYLAKIYASADVFLFPSVSEAYGNVVLEAMASGLPCVIANGGGSKDFIEQGVNGFKCDPYSAKDYIGRITTLLCDKTLHQKFAEQGLALSASLSWEKLAEEYFDDVTRLHHAAATASITPPLALAV